MFVAIHCHKLLVGVPPNPGIRRKYSAAARSENAFSTDKILIYNKLQDHLIIYWI